MEGPAAKHVYPGHALVALLVNYCRAVGACECVQQSERLTASRPLLRPTIALITKSRTHGVFRLDSCPSPHKPSPPAPSLLCFCPADRRHPPLLSISATRLRTRGPPGEQQLPPYA
ncbi:hypothetical protein BV20DRAFT_628483 [Pilatotrama ljubarskyi]|nr:hypothetical protein BV20DRAFT_628483 [Pilatotrama ljubarskyi]